MEPYIELVKDEQGDVEDDLLSINELFCTASGIEERKSNECAEFLGAPSVSQKSQLSFSLEDFQSLLHHHEMKLFTKYSIHKTNGNFTDVTKLSNKFRVHWSLLEDVSASMRSTPYLLLASRYYTCHMGKCYYKSKLRKVDFDKKKTENHTKQYRKLTESKKVGCPAWFKVQRLIFFPDCKLEFDNRTARARMSEYIKRNLSSIKKKEGYLFKFPEAFHHTNHLKGSQTVPREPIDKCIINKINEFVTDGICDPDEIRMILNQYVQNELKHLHTNHRRFYPTSSDIRRLIFTSKMKLRKSLMDDDELLLKIGKWGEHAKVFFRNNKNTLFVYQNVEMQRLYALHGPNCILVDSTHKFCALIFPMYSILVNTNVCLQVVALIVTDNDNQEMLSEGLSVIREWNPMVTPKYAASDQFIHLRSVESIFSEIKTYMPLFYSVRQWKKYFKQNNIKDDQSFEILNDIATCHSDSIQSRIENLKSSDGYNALKIYFDKYLHKHLKKWVGSYHPHDCFLEANESIENYYDNPKYRQISQWKNLPLSSLLNEWIMNYLNEMLNHYATMNSIYKRTTCSYAPSYLSNSPQPLVDDILMQVNDAEKDLSECHVQFVKEGCFNVIDKLNNTYEVTFNQESSSVHCSCINFLQKKRPCKHIIMIGLIYPIWSFSSVPWIINNPVFQIDHKAPSFQYSTSQLTVNREVIEDTIKRECVQKIQNISEALAELNGQELQSFSQDLYKFWSIWGNHSKSTHQCFSTKIDSSQVNVSTQRSRHVKKISNLEMK